MKYGLIVFDWDGTLMDSEARIIDCMQAAVSDLGLAPPSRQRIRDIIGLGLKEAVETLLPSTEPEAVEEITLRYRHHFLEENTTPSVLFPGAQAVVEWLRTRGYLLAVATGKGRRGLDRALRETGLGGSFHATRCADETRSKPHPAMLLEIMNELGVSAQDTLMVGDTEYDVLMAKNAGASAMAVSYGVHERTRLLAHRPVGCVDDLFALRDWLASSEAAAFSARAEGSSTA